ncbi:MAG: tetratricopeptide repeat protein [Acidobacteria bacterium]|nr:tetratricopeptide repeat protein [Acidobacteriota bacterium]
MPQFPIRAISRGRVAQVVPAARLATVLVLVLLLWVAASVLTRTAHDQRTRRVARAAGAGERALADGHPEAAASALREAVGLEPDRADHRLALARALVAGGHDREALPYVNEVLRQAPVDGEANLVLARILRTTGANTEAESAYYKAIFGRWAPDRFAGRQQARLELVALYEETGDTARLRAALLELSAAFPGDRTLQMHAADRLLAIGSVDEAARVLRSAMERFADPGDAPARLAMAEVRRGNAAAAYDIARRALARDAQDAAARAARDLAASVLSIDPSLPRLSGAERTRRTRRLLAEASNRLESCDAAGTAGGPVTLPVAARRWLGQPRADADAGYALLEALARRLRERCPAPTDTDAIGLVLGRLIGEHRDAQ